MGCNIYIKDNEIHGKKKTLDDTKMIFIFEKSNSHNETIILNYYTSHNVVLDCTYKAKTLENR